MKAEASLMKTGFKAWNSLSKTEELIKFHFRLFSLDVPEKLLYDFKTSGYQLADIQVRMRM